jgi:hypothetical protein
MLRAGEEYADVRDISYGPAKDMGADEAFPGKD